MGPIDYFIWASIPTIFWCFFLPDEQGLGLVGIIMFKLKKSIVDTLKRKNKVFDS